MLMHTTIAALLRDIAHSVQPPTHILSADACAGFRPLVIVGNCATNRPPIFGYGHITLCDERVCLSVWLPTKMGCHLHPPICELLSPIALALVVIGLFQTLTADVNVNSEFRGRYSV